MNSDKPDGIQVIDRVASILKILVNHKDGLSLGQISKLSGLSRSTVHRLTTAMKKHQWIDNSNGIALGSGLFELFDNYDTHIIEIIRPQLDTLFKKSGETITLAKLTGHEITFIDRRISQQELRFVPNKTTGFPANCLSNGKVLLALKTDSEIKQLFHEGLPNLTAHSISHINDFLEEINQIRKTGLAFDHEEYTLGITSIGISITQKNGMAYSITISSPTQRFKQRSEFLIQLLKTSKEHIKSLLK